MLVSSIFFFSHDVFKSNFLGIGKKRDHSVKDLRYECKEGFYYVQVSLRQSGDNPIIT